MMYLAYDTETTGLPIDPSSPIYTDVLNWPRVYQVGAILFDEMGFEYGRMNSFVRPYGWNIPEVDDFLKSMGAESFHEKQGITTEMLLEKGKPMHEVMTEFLVLARQADAKVCHNALFDNPVMSCEMFRHDMLTKEWLDKPQYCTKELTTDMLQLPGGLHGHYKWPNLQEAYRHFFGKEFDDAHDAMADVQATMEVFLEIQYLL